MKKCIVISALGEKSFSAGQIKKLKLCGDVSFVAQNRLLNDKEFVEALQGYEIAAITRRIRKDISAKVLSELPCLQALAVFSTGYEWIDTEYMRTHGIKLAYLPDYSTVSVAEHTVGLIISSLRRMHLSYDFSRDMLDQNVSMRGFELCGKKIGIIGFGRIGQKVYSMLSVFGVGVSYYDIDENKKNLLKDKYKDFDELISDVDILVLCASKKRDERPLLGFLQIALMKKGIIIINPARADLVDNNAVAENIKAGKIFTYAVDEKTKAFDDIEKGRIIETGHTAWYSTEAINRGTDTWVENIAGLCCGNPVNLVEEGNFEADQL